MNRILITPALALLLLSLTGCICFSALTPLAKVTLRVVDESGTPMAGASAGVTFMYGGTWTDPGKFVGAKGLTDTNGYFSASGRTEWRVAYGARQSGYYRTTGLKYIFREPKLGRWQPWNPELKVVLKKIGQPTAMYAKRVEVELPKLNEPVGYDLVIGDLVAPFGKGSKADFIFKATKNFVNIDNYEGALEVTFGSKGDGIQSCKTEKVSYSELRLPAMAPDAGYEEKWTKSVIRKGRIDVNVLPDETQNFYFRVRTVGLEDGIHRSWYGKIHGDIEFYMVYSKTAFIRFTYYLNPDGTRNVEFDPAKNLFRNLPWIEGVRKP